MKKVKIINGQIITPYRIIKNGTLLINGHQIEAIEEGDIEAADYELIDAKGNYVSPGFIDIHIHGGGGHDFMDATEEAYLKIAEIHATYGTTAMAPTTLTCAKEDLLKAIDLYKSTNAKNTKGAQFIGMHLEGPYFALSQSGAQDPRYIRNPDLEEYKEVIAYGAEAIKRWSVAPELPGAIEMGKYLKSHGIIAAIAHTDAIYEEVLEAVENGYSLATHLYSAMSGVTRRNTYRYAGVIESAFLIDAMDVEIIADGIHLPAPLLKLVYKIKGPDRIALITDAMRGAGMPEGESILGNKDTGLKVIIENGVAIMADRSSFAGSVATTDRLVRTMVQMADIPLVEAVRMMSRTPATIMGVENTKGTLTVGKDADVLIFDENINIKTTMINGTVVYSSADFV
ncbi:N-acetylglucosamine-6-phosphate deacetylase [Pedobacter hiemivivus]|uniref:N-acetylglucosamine-6-phosphate deacetylase n=1 Tax=Pedobacter hiemivivus TaxID=2530454 RepID=A0A4U1GL61_9SPHI|nr:N-acetylglucosamine-6-phosphate deacetylase [Pedobacter hiemivivus]TCC99428.1 N-acetylglucosamine-6-phosphate deacetylase [Pedobacter hiemivivus]TKC63723.1 N-acetylglucosamine-6-phosphate deacetylase [Pedobacter hiemivivus]